MALNEKIQRTYATISALDGSIRVAVDKPGNIDETVDSYIDEDGKKVVRRDYELSDGTEGCKWEHVYKSITGFIKYVGLYDGDYGTQLSLTIADEGEEGIILSLNCKQNFAQDLMKKLKNIDFSAEVDLRPYSFEDDKGKNKKGVTVWQEGEKIQSYFWDPEAKEVTHNFPEPEGDTSKFDSDDWVVFFVGVTKFLKAFVTENILPMFEVEGDDKPQVDEVLKTKKPKAKAKTDRDEEEKPAKAKAKAKTKKAVEEAEENAADTEEEDSKKAKNTKPPF